LKIGSTLNNQKKILLFLDNLRVGGIQRLALDEAYCLSSRGYEVEIILLEKVRELDDMREIDADFFNKHRIKVTTVTGSNYQKIKGIALILKRSSATKVISHSSKGIALLRISSFLIFREIEILGYIHQLITLSDNIQRLKRIVFFSLASELRASSKQFVLELEMLFEKRQYLKLILRKKIKFDRMGVFVERIIAQDNQSPINVANQKTSLIFMSRVAIWKGFGRYLSIARELRGEFNYIAITSRFHNDVFEVEQACSEIGVQLMYGTNVARANRGYRSIHLYPADYGNKINFPQNLGLNVLESMALGIPSLISHEELWSWPELEKSKLIWMTDWSVPDVKAKIDEIVKMPNSAFLEEAKALEHVFSIEEHIERIIEFLE